MKFEDAGKVSKLVANLTAVQDEMTLIRHDSTQNYLGVTFGGRYQDGEVLDAVRPVVLALLQRKADALIAELTELGVEVPPHATPGILGPVTQFLLHEAHAHVPANLNHIDREEWIAGFLNRAILTPNTPLCDCCGDD